jgi:hypothetical protein
LLGPDARMMLGFFFISNEKLSNILTQWSHLIKMSWGDESSFRMKMDHSEYETRDRKTCCSTIAMYFAIKKKKHLAIFVIRSSKRYRSDYCDSGPKLITMSIILLNVPHSYKEFAIL